MSTELVAGWEKVWDATQNRHYWWNEATEESTWEEPKAPEPAKQSMKSFLDPNMAAGFPRTMRNESTRTAEQSALVNDFMADAPEPSQDASITQEADSFAADFLTEGATASGGQARAQSSQEVASLSGGRQPPAFQDMSAVEDSDDDLYEDEDTDEDDEDDDDDDDDESERILETPGEVDR